MRRMDDHALSARRAGRRVSNTSACNALMRWESGRLLCIEWVYASHPPQHKGTEAHPGLLDPVPVGLLLDPVAE